MKQDDPKSVYSWPRWVQRHWAHSLVLLVWGSVALLTRQYLQDRGLTFDEMAAALRTLLRGNWYGPLLYTVAYLIRPLTLFPSSILTLLAGNVFGLWPGFIIALLAGTLSSLPGYAIGRWFSAEAGDTARSGALLQRFVGSLRQHPFQTVVVMRLLYLPYDPANILAGYLKIPFTTYFVATVLGNIPATVAYISLGASIQGTLADGQLTLNPYTIALSVLLFSASIGFSWLYKRRQKNHTPSGETQESGNG